MEAAELQVLSVLLRIRSRSLDEIRIAPRLFFYIEAGHKVPPLESRWLRSATIGNNIKKKQEVVTYLAEGAVGVL